MMIELLNDAIDIEIIEKLPRTSYNYHGAVKRHEELTKASSMCAKKSTDGLHLQIALVGCVECVNEHIRTRT